MLKGWLGLETARIRHSDRHGLLWLERGELCGVNGCLHFARGNDMLGPTLDQIPHHAVSMILLGPGSSVTPSWRWNWLGTSGNAARELVEFDGMWLTRRSKSQNAL
jgi:hypothetical protein